ncbi:MAG: hypothetical protein KAI33_07675, partial [Elusimicrobiales bacterium]|nr:hypothetical protein [Elusimicrobiales bacterium]
SLHEAMKNALALVVGVYVSQEALVSKAILIDDSITSQTEGYIEKYEIIKEWKDGDFYKTRIKAHVRREDLSAKLKNFENEPSKLGNPVIAFFIEETVDGKPMESHYCELEIKNTFAEAGFAVSDKQEGDILISGTASSDFNTQEGLGGFTSYRAALSAKAVKTGSEEVLLTVQSSAGGIDLSKKGAARAALINASKKIALEIKDGVLKALRKKTLIKITVENAETMNKLSEFIKALRNIPTVRDCWLRTFNGGKNAVLDVNLRRSNAADFSQILGKNKRFKVEIINSTSYSLNLRIQPK